MKRAMLIAEAVALTLKAGGTTTGDRAASGGVLSAGTRGLIGSLYDPA